MSNSLLQSYKMTQTEFAVYHCCILETLPNLYSHGISLFKCHFGSLHLSKLPASLPAFFLSFYSFYLFFILMVIEESSMAKPLKLFMGMQTLGC